MVQLLDRFVETVLAAAKWLALPVVTLLFLQWPLRSVFGHYSREANDLGQWLFALYVAASITAATRAKTHLAADTIARRYSETSRKWLARAGALLGLIPWSILVIVTSWQTVLNATRGLERFPDTFNPGYFMIKIALLLLALLMLIEGVIELSRPRMAQRP
jgi:TRAP-type mannitol/chloroaromatic compound transport system permease small subunit